MEYVAQCYAQPVEVLLQNTKQVIVHSIFSNSFNLLVGEHLLHIGDYANGLSPFGVGVSKTIVHNLLTASSGGAILTYLAPNKQFIWPDHTALSLYGTQQVSAKMPCLGFSYLALSMALEALSPYIGQYLRQKEFGLEMEELVDELTALKGVFSKAKSHVIQVLDFWIGRGMGLTPTGDDMVVGMLAVYFAAAHTNTCGMVINYIFEKAKTRTTAIAYEYLYHAAYGAFSQDVICLIHALQVQTPYKDHLNRLLRVGHSSGKDILFGIYLALQQLWRDTTI